MSKLFKERVPFKQFEYPIYYNEGWLKQAQAFWLHTEIPMQMDVKDWNSECGLSSKAQELFHKCRPVLLTAGGLRWSSVGRGDDSPGVWGLEARS